MRTASATGLLSDDLDQMQDSAGKATIKLIRKYQANDSIGNTFSTLNGNPYCQLASPLACINTS